MTAGVGRDVDLSTVEDLVERNDVTHVDSIGRALGWSPERVAEVIGCARDRGLLYLDCRGNLQALAPGSSSAEAGGRRGSR